MTRTTTVPSTLALAIESAQAGNTILARMHLQEVLAAEPENLDAWLWLAWCSESPDSAVRSLEHLLMLDPDHELAWKGLMWASEMAEFRLAAAAGSSTRNRAAAASVAAVAAADSHSQQSATAATAVIDKPAEGRPDIDDDARSQSDTDTDPAADPNVDANADTEPEHAETASEDAPATAAQEDATGTLSETAPSASNSPEAASSVLDGEANDECEATGDTLIMSNLAVAPERETSAEDAGSVRTAATTAAERTDQQNNDTSADSAATSHDSAKDNDRAATPSPIAGEEWKTPESFEPETAQTEPLSSGVSEDHTSDPAAAESPEVATDWDSRSQGDVDDRSETADSFAEQQDPANVAGVHTPDTLSTAQPRDTDDADDTDDSDVADVNNSDIRSCDAMLAIEEVAQQLIALERSDDFDPTAEDTSDVVPLDDQTESGGEGESVMSESADTAEFAEPGNAVDTAHAADAPSTELPSWDPNPNGEQAWLADGTPAIWPTETTATAERPAAEPAADVLHTQSEESNASGVATTPAPAFPSTADNASDSAGDSRVHTSSAAADASISDPAQADRENTVPTADVSATASAVDSEASDAAVEHQHSQPPAETSDVDAADAAPVILVVDDSATVRKLVSMTLQKHGYRVVTAFDGVAAIKEIAANNPALILMDINMPRLDGYQLCKLVKKHPATKHIPIIMLSGKDGVFDKLRGKLVGCTGYITKPFSPEALVQTLEQELHSAAVV